MVPACLGRAASYREMVLNKSYLVVCFLQITREDKIQIRINVILHGKKKDMEGILNILDMLINSLSR